MDKKSVCFIRAVQPIYQQHLENGGTGSDAGYGAAAETIAHPSKKNCLLSYTDGHWRRATRHILLCNSYPPGLFYSLRRKSLASTLGSVQRLRRSNSCRYCFYQLGSCRQFLPGSAQSNTVVVAIIRKSSEQALSACSNMGIVTLLRFNTLQLLHFSFSKRNASSSSNRVA